MDFKFLSNEEIFHLRQQGKVAISQHACHLFAFLLSFFFFLQQLSGFDWQAFLFQENLSAIKPVILEICQLALSSMAIYLLALLFFAALQSRFYFSVAKVFSSNIREGRAVFSVGTLMRLIALFAVAFLMLFAWFQIALQSMAFMNQASDINGFMAFLQELAGSAGLIMLFAAAALIFIAKLAFRLDNKLLQRKH